MRLGLRKKGIGIWSYFSDLFPCLAIFDALELLID